MKIEKLLLPKGWYSISEQEIIDKYQNKALNITKNVFGALVAHAGWFFCGESISKAISSLDESIETLIITGGHLGEHSNSRITIPDRYETLGKELECDIELSNLLAEDNNTDIVESIDNSVEVVIPMVGFLRPDLKIVTMQIAPNSNYLTLADIITEYKRNNRKIGFLATSDLTHWGPNYGFMPAESISNPIEWCKTSDNKIMDLVVKYKDEQIITMANEKRNSCCGGSIALFSNFCKKGKLELSLREYSSSYDKHPTDSFVGYPLMLFSKN